MSNDAIEHKGIRDDVRDIHSKMERAGVRTDKKLDKILDGLSDHRERLTAVEKTVEPLPQKVDSNSRAIQKAHGAIALIVLLFGSVKVAAALGWIQ